MLKIIVDTEEQKQNLLRESEYLHYLPDVDTDIASTLTHIYMNPDLIEVRAPLTEGWGKYYDGAKCMDCEYFERDTLMDTMGFCTDPHLYPEGTDQTWRPLDASPNTPTCFTTEETK